MIFDLSRTRTLMSALGDPQDRFVAVHVAGTNGKGSVCAMIDRSLRLAKLRTGLYTSPHLQRINERFRIDGHDIPDADLRRLSGRIERLVRSGRLPKPTQFEALTAIAFVWFAERHVDLAVVEVGLGGRLDSTNVMPHVAVSVITSIGLDHMEWLGRTEALIAGEKAGIVRVRTPVVTGATGPALGVIRNVAARWGAPLDVVSRPYEGKTSLAGPHQRINAAVAQATLRRLAALGFPIREGDIRSGIATAVWPGRLERFSLGAGQNRISCLLDGAHNLHAARALSAALRELRLSDLTVVFGALRDKDARGIAKELAPHASRVICVTAPSDRAIPALEIAQFPEWKGKATVGRLPEALGNARPGASVLVTGSLYVVGKARELMAGSLGNKEI